MSSSKSNIVSSAKFHVVDYDTLRKSFNKAYNVWFKNNFIPEELYSEIKSYEVTPEEFDKLTKNRQLQRYIALIDGIIRFDELPVPPHGAIIGTINKSLARQLDGPNDMEILVMVNDDGMLFSDIFLRITIDVRINNRSIKRPDSSFKIRPSQIPVSPPNWLKMQPNGHPYPNIVVEVAVNHESPQKLLGDMQRYFSRRTSIRVWIGVKYWAAERKFWVGWAERRVGGVGGKLHTQMQWPPNHHDINISTNIVYNISMPTIFGPNIPMPPGLSPTLTIDTDVIRLMILEEVNFNP